MAPVRSANSGYPWALSSLSFHCLIVFPAPLPSRQRMTGKGRLVLLLLSRFSSLTWGLLHEPVIIPEAGGCSGSAPFLYTPFLE